MPALSKTIGDHALRYLCFKNLTNHKKGLQPTRTMEFFYLDLLYPGTFVVQTAQINCVVCSLLTVMKFRLDKKNSKRKPIGGLFILLLKATTGC